MITHAQAVANLKDAKLLLCIYIITHAQAAARLEVAKLL